MRWNGVLATTIAAMVLGVGAAPAAADSFTVTGTDDIPGNCAGTACTSIRAALSAAAATASQEDQVALPAGTFQLTQGPLAVTTPVTVTGAGARKTTIVAAPNSRVVEITGVTASLAGLTVSGGVATDVAGFFGGNIAAKSSTVVLDHIRSTGGQAYSGGGIANRNGVMVIQNSLVDHNSATNGGGDSGGVLNFGGDGLAAASMTIANSTVAFNTAKAGGGVMQWGNDQDSLTLQSVTLARNTSTNSGAPAGLNISQGTAQVGGSIIASNQNFSGEINCGGTGLASIGANVDSGVDCNFTQQTDRSDQNPALSDELRNYGGQTDVLPFAEPSPAENIGGLCPSTDQTGFTRTAPCDAGAWEYRVDTTVMLSDAPAGPRNRQTAAFDFSSAAGSDYECRLIRPSDANPAFAACDSGIAYDNLAEGAYRFEVRPAGATDLSQGDFTTFSVDVTAPTVTITAPAAGEPVGSDPTFAFGASEAGVRFACALAQGQADLVNCESPTTFHGLADGQSYTLSLRGTDAAGNVGPTITRTFTVGAGQPQATATPEPTATAIPAPTATPTPTAVPPRTIEPVKGTVLIKQGGKFVALKEGVLKNGSEIDTRKGTVQISDPSGNTASFYDGIFKVTESGGYIVLTLSEKLTGCPKAKKSSASAAAKKPKTRKLWGDGKGKFRTKGQYSAATVRGTKWLVTDTCTSTITRVAEGVVSVRDEVKKKTLVLRKGKSYTARAKK